MRGVWVEVGAQPPWRLRAGYLDSLREPQELYLEGRVARGRALVLQAGAEPLGYAVVHEATVVEYHLASRDGAHAAEALWRLLDLGVADRTLVKSFDEPLLAAALARRGEARAVGHLFRGFQETAGAPGRRLEGRAARPEDLEAVLAMHDGFFDDEGEIQSYLSVAGLHLYHSPAGELLGCGLHRLVIQGRADADVGMVVGREHREMGLGARIAADVARRCVEAGLRPIAGCSVDNSRSRRALVSAGFVETHALLEIHHG